MQMRSLVDAMTNLNMLRSNEMILHPLIFPVQDAMNTAYAEIKPLADAKSQKVTVDLPDEPVPVSGDLEKLTAAFVGLLNNAVRFTPAGGKISLGASVQDDQILGWVQDNGIGLQGAELKKIFQEFYQVAPHTTRKMGGLGIGLNIVKGLIEAHGGKIWAESAGLNKGTCMRVELPLAKG
jgi:signal transduction histidine kinase